jgi:Ca2+-binding EF-hand superfamily protein
VFACNRARTHKQVFKAMDANADGYISREEFVKAFEPKVEKVSLPKHPTADDMIDFARRRKSEKV